MKINLMKSKYALLFVGFSAFLWLASGCQSGMQDYKEMDNGLKYKIIEFGKGDSVKVGDYMKAHIRVLVHDSVLTNTYEDNNPQWIPIQPSNGQKYDLMAGFNLLHDGDSVEFVIPADSVMNPMNRPPFVEEGDKIEYFLKVLNVVDSADYDEIIAKETEERAEEQKEAITKYVDDLGKKAEKTEEGVYVVVDDEGSGDYPKDGQTISIMYTGKLLDGTKFDSNQDSSFHHTDPLVFPLGQGRVIPGMDSGLKLFKKGAKGSMIIPSDLAYGPNGQPPVIKPNSVLVFDVEVLDITDKPDPSTPQGK